jgi:hypothetical protein
MKMTTVRQWHSYIGLFIAPSVLFFALTGVTQLFGLHESHGDYQPPAIVEKLSSVHKDQVFELGHHHAPPPASEAGPRQPPAGAQDDDDKTELSTQLLKWFFMLVALSLTLSTCFGIWMGFTQMRRKRLAWTLLVAGALIPTALLVA